MCRIGCLSKRGGCEWIWLEIVTCAEEGVINRRFSFCVFLSTGSGSVVVSLF